MEPDEDGRAPVRFQKLHAVDVVGDPASTRGGLFQHEVEMSDNTESREELEVTPEAQPEELQEQPEVQAEELSQEPQEAPEELSEQPEQLAEELPQYEQYIEAFGDKGAVWYLRKKPLNECFAEVLHDVNQRCKALEDENAELKSQLEFASQNLGEDVATSQSTELEELSEAEKQHEAKVKEMKENGWSDQEIRWANLFSTEIK